MTENILQFPKNKIIRENMNIEYLEKMKENGVKNFADALCSDIEDNVLRELDGCGIDIEQEDFIKDFYFATTVLKATVYRALEIEHDLHKFMDENVVVKMIDEVDSNK
jgi:hypothetical protein